MDTIKSVTIIGAGNMGSAIAGGLLKHSSCRITLANRSEERLLKSSKTLRAITPENGATLSTTTDLQKSVADAGLIILAVKPWAIDEVIEKIRPAVSEDAVVISVAAGISLNKLEEMLGAVRGGIVYMIPNTAILVGKGMTFAAVKDVEASKCDAINGLFSPITKLKFVDESKMQAGMALCSCGIAYVYRFIAAAAQAGVELGFSYDEAAEYFTATVAGAAAMIESSDLTLQQHINAVTTPGGITIRGLNALERNGFTSAVIDSLLAVGKR